MAARKADTSFKDHLERLASEAGCTAEVVQDLYQEEIQHLQRRARVGTYIPVLAMKRVRDALRRTGAKIRAAAQEKRVQ
jgi:Protein of unknown function (DUF3562)